MRLGTATQQPTERQSYTVDYSQALTEGDNIETAFAVVNPAGLTVDNVLVMDPKVRFWVNGGTSGTVYKVTLTVNTADGRVLQDEIIFKIKEV